MSKRLQVLLEETELRDIQKIARRKRMTVAEWVRQALRDARRREPMRDVTKKLEAVRMAARHEFPTADVDAMLAEIERGYMTPDAP
jgi:predicted 2-oxoglutarate/Fe(II)-dependent dioxygenase YbiX